MKARELTMQDRLLAAAYMETLAMGDLTLRVIADTVIDCVRCCDFFPECAHVVDESERVDREEGTMKPVAATVSGKGKGAWYFIYVRACAICGATIVERERRYDERPADPAERREYVETACQGHFL